MIKLFKNKWINTISLCVIISAMISEMISDKLTVVWFLAYVLALTVLISSKWN